MKPDWCPQDVWKVATRVFGEMLSVPSDVFQEETWVMDTEEIARAILQAKQEAYEDAGADIAERLRLRSVAINEALVEQRDIDAAVLMSCDLPNIPAAAIRAKLDEVQK